MRHELITGNAGDNGGLIAAARNRVRVVISDHLPHTTTACGSAPSGLTKLSKLLSETVLSDLPVENVSLDDAVEFCKKLSELPEEKKAGRVYHLPTEAQWEYACLAGSKTIYSFDDGEGLLPEYGWFKRNSSQRTHTVGLLEPNAWGLYDMHGNVWEWCSDRDGLLGFRVALSSSRIPK